MIKQGSWVRIHGVVVNPGDRSANVPEDTSKVPLEFWTKGYLKEDANIGDEVTVETQCGRLQKGTLIEENPIYELNYGKLIPELLKIGRDLRSLLED